MRVVVVGAGIAGLSVAHLLKREAARRARPLQLSLYESGARAGGRIRTLADSGYLVECAADAVVGLEGAAARLADDLGLSRERVIAAPDAARRYVMRHGRLHRLSLKALLASRLLSPRARLRLLAEPLMARRGEGDESVYEFATRHIGPEAALTLVGTAVRGMFAGDAAGLSVEAAFPAMREMERTSRSLVVAAARGRRSPGGRTLWSLQGGMEAFVRALADSADRSLHLSAPVLSIERAAEGRRPRWSARLASGEIIEADQVVIATPPKAAASLLRGLAPKSAERLATISAASLAVVALALRLQAFRTAPDGYGFLVAPDEPIEILGALYESNLFPARAPQGSVLVRVLMGGAERPDLLVRSDPELVALAVNGLDRALGLVSRPERTWVIRQHEAIPQYAVGHRTLVDAIERGLDASPGLHLSGSAYRGVSVGSLVEDAVRVADRVMAGPARPCFGGEGVA
jgi:oxygen-dependent protoporphyrinogen oxidase